MKLTINKQDKIIFKMLALSLALIIMMLVFRDHKEYVSALVLVLGIIFAIDYKRSMPYFFVLVFLVYTQFCSLTSSISTGGINFKTAIALGTVIIFLLMRLRIHKQNIPMIIFLLLCAVSILVAYFKFGQPFSYSVTIYIQEFAIFLLVYPLAIYIAENDAASIFFSYCYYIIVFACILLLIQYYLIPNNAFLDITLANRYTGESGYLIHVVSPFMCFILEVKLMQSQKRVCDWIGCGIIVMTLIFVAQTRIFMFGAVVMIIYSLFFHTGKISGKSKLGIVLIAAMIILPNIATIVGALANQFLSSVLESGTDYIRFRELLWFNSMNSTPKLFGLGIQNRAYSGSPYLTGVEVYKYYVSDLGVAGMFFQYGLLGIIGMMLYMISLWKLENKQLTDLHENGYTKGLILLVLCTCFTVSPMQYALPIILCDAMLLGNILRLKQLI